MFCSHREAYAKCRRIKPRSTPPQPVASVRFLPSLGAGAPPFRGTYAWRGAVLWPLLFLGALAGREQAPWPLAGRGL